MESLEFDEDIDNIWRWGDKFSEYIVQINSYLIYLISNIYLVNHHSN